MATPGAMWIWRWSIGSELRSHLVLPVWRESGADLDQWTTQVEGRLSIVGYDYPHWVTATSNRRTHDVPPWMPHLARGLTDLTDDFVILGFNQSGDRYRLLLPIGRVDQSLADEARRLSGPDTPMVDPWAVETNMRRTAVFEGNRRMLGPPRT